VMDRITVQLRNLSTPVEIGVDKNTTVAFSAPAPFRRRRRGALPGDGESSLCQRRHCVAYGLDATCAGDDGRRG